MKQTMLGENKTVFARRTRRIVAVCAGLCVLTAGVNVCLVLLHSTDNHALLIAVNAVLDIAFGWYVMWRFDDRILPRKRMLRLYEMQGDTISGVVEDIFSRERYMDFDCLPVLVAGHRLFVIDNGTITVHKGEMVTVEAVRGIVKEVAS